MFFSIIIYILFGTTLWLLAGQDVTLSKRIPTSKNKLTVWSWIYIFIFTLVSALRYNLGADCEEYVYNYTRGQTSEWVEKGEYLFAYINTFIHDLGFGRVGFLGLWAFVEIFFFYAALRNRKYLLPFISLVLVLGPHYYGWMNGIRQMVVACMFVFAMQQKIDYGRYVLYAIIILIGSIIHHSAIYLLLFLLIPNIDFFDNTIINRYIVIAAVIFSAVLGQQGWVKEPLNLLALATSDFASGYENYTDKMTVFTEELAADLAYGPRRLIILFVTLIIIWFYPKMKRYYNDRFLVFCYTLFVVFAIFPENLLSSVHSSMSRPFMYFKPFKLLCNAYLLLYVKNTYIKKNPLLFYTILALSICYMIMDSIAEANNAEETTLFKFYFLQN